MLLTVSFSGVGDIARVPFQIPSGSQKLILEVSVISEIHFQQVRAVCDEKTFEFSSPLVGNRLKDLAVFSDARLQRLETKWMMKSLVYTASHQPTAVVIEAELAGGPLFDVEESDEAKKTGDEEDTSQTMIPKNLPCSGFLTPWV